MPTSLDILESEFCPPLEPALVYAIYDDFADSPDGLDRARELLGSIKQSAVLEQETGFDPSASSGPAYQSSGDIISELGSLDASSGTAASENTEITRSSKNLSSGSVDEGIASGSGSSVLQEGADGAGDVYLESVEALDAATKEARLIEFFPTLKPSLVAYTLRKCDWSFSKTTDELLNQVYFEFTDGDEKVATKGVDAFFIDDHSPRVGKNKAKRTQRDAESPGESLRSHSPGSPREPNINRWKDGSHAVEFIAPRVSMSTAEVGSIYHSNGCSARATIQAILDTDTKKHEGKEAASIFVDHAMELLGDFPSMDLNQAISLTRITHPSTAHAHELAKMLFTSIPETPKGSIQLIRRYAPISLSDSPPSSPEPARAPLPLTSRAPSSAALAAARDTAFAQADAAHRKGKSDPLMRAAAGYYGQVGRDYNAAFKAASAADADARVRAQSSPTQLDLHGVGLQDATRIARESVTAWWHGLGEGKINGRGIGPGYRIVTGVGYHSEGGRGKIGPAVGRMLIREGWKVEFGTGYLVVKGVVKTK